MTSKSKTTKTTTPARTKPANIPAKAARKTSTKAQEGPAKVFEALARIAATTPAPARGKRVRKGSRVVVKERPPFVARLIDASKAIHVILEADRPKTSPALPAHTHAVLTSLGMLAKNRPSVREATLATLFGVVAIRHHVAAENLERVNGGKIRLTAEGLAKFTARAESPAFDTALAQAYADVFVEGKIAPILGLKAGQVFQVGVAL